jgi:hypothetical protein
MLVHQEGAQLLLSVECKFSLSRQELAFRTAILFSGLDLANAFGAVITYSLSSRRYKI